MTPRILSILGFWLLVALVTPTLAQPQYYNHRDEGRLVYEAYQQQRQLAEPFAKTDRAVGILDRGELANVTSNFGILSNFHLFSPAFHWPRYADDTHQYCFGLNLMIGIDGDVVTSIFDPNTVAENYNWEAVDGALGDLHSGDVIVSDGTPVLASSDNPETWPVNNDGQRYWPGRFRLDPDTGAQVSGEFVSERDVYAVYTDSENLNGAYGLEIHQTSYSFSRSYAEDFIIFDIRIINTSGADLDSVWVGYFADFKVDFDTHDLIKFTNLAGNPNARKDLIYQWDGDSSQGIWDVTGYIGMLTLATPGNRGITDFHFFDNIYEPSTNAQLWEIMTSDTSGTNITPENFFHGDNYRRDDTDLAADMDPSGEGRGTDFDFIVSTGPVTIAAGDTVVSAFAIVLGETEAEMLANADIVKSMSQRAYLGPNAPQSPKVQAFPGDQRVTLTWDGRETEMSRDLLTERLDFEGYRIYRSEDQGQTWGDVVTDDRGNIIGFVPIAQFDLDNDISGTDPNSNFYLGDNTGLRHTFIDSTVINGREYWYTVTAYDRGDVETSIPALESSRGVTTEEPNLVAVIPAAPVRGLHVPAIENADSLVAIGGTCDSRVSIEIVDPMALTGDNYRITFNDLGLVISADEAGLPDSTVTTTFNLINQTTGEVLLSNYPLLNETGDNVPVTDGFRVLARDTEGGVKSMCWTNLPGGQTPTFEWRDTNFEAVADNPQVGPEGIFSSDDYRITVDFDEGTWVGWYDVFGGFLEPDTLVHVPLKFEIVTDPDNPIDISASSWLMEYDLYNTFVVRDNFFSPLGWDLEPGGAGYNPNVPLYSFLWVDIIAPRHTVTDPETGLTREYMAMLITQNYPETYQNQYGETVTQTPIVPADGSQFTIETKKLFRSEIYYEFSTEQVELTHLEYDLEAIKVVPNPFIVRAGWETSQYEGRLQFTNLPPTCDIDIYTVAGDHVASLAHTDGSSYEFWDLQNKSNVNVAFGLYVYVVKTPEGDEQIGRFAVIR